MEWTPEAPLGWEPGGGAGIQLGGLARSTGSTARAACRPRRLNSSSAALRAIPNNQARGLPRRGSNRERLR